MVLAAEVMDASAGRSDVPELCVPMSLKKASP